MIRSMPSLSAIVSSLAFLSFLGTKPQGLICGQDLDAFVGDDLIGLRLEVPAPINSRYPNLCEGPHGSSYLCWLSSRESNETKLEYCRIEGTRVSPARTIATGKNWFANWADFPSICAARDGTLAAHWLERNGEATYAYGVRIAVSNDDGQSWGESHWLHEDRTENEHGFVTIIPRGENGFAAFWLDSRDSRKTGNMALYSRNFDSQLTFGPEVELDPRVCSCCQTAAWHGDKGTVVAYRDRSRDEIRDTSLIRIPKSGGGPSQETLVEDGWFVPT